MPDERVLSEWPRRLTVDDLRLSLLEFRDILDEPNESETRGAWLERVAERFDFHSAPVPKRADAPLFTGYYQPVLEASLIETAQYRYPLYAVPDRPTLSRRDIDVSGQLAGGGHEIAWLKDPVDRFFLHIQGSGLLELKDGKRLYVNFAASNERPYTSIGKVLIEAGKLARDSLSMQRIRRYLAEHPDEMDELVAMNERYVFFRI
jgi:membrane-bound lytic murein transglycosylase A